MLSIDARLRWNHTGFRLTKGRRYRLTVPPNQQWRDWIFRCGPEGYGNPLVAAFTPFLRIRRAAGGTAQFFTLIGTVDESTTHAFIIGKGTDFTAPTDGELVCFANDVLWAYSNNHGSITINIAPLST